ncbi:bifunctional Phosphatidylinositol 3--4-kinase [Babesia duncani]|uniref:1-phosphatidylinositol 4-kinase n=1 Tax=Babesia duncani TaxID=323732 RepID=A0AAD9UP52_9APIC|nr:bifunctional Phosphatidylinositol 3--4-kinase [Babesia duncani]
MAPKDPNATRVATDTQNSTNDPKPESLQMQPQGALGDQLLKDAASPCGEPTGDKVTASPGGEPTGDKVTASQGGEPTGDKVTASQGGEPTCSLGSASSDETTKDGQTSQGSFKESLPGSITTSNSSSSSVCSDNVKSQTSAKSIDSKALSSVSSTCNAPSRKKKEKHLVGTSENPLDVTELSVDSTSLLELYQNDYFDAYMHMHHLFHRDVAGVHEYLVNLLYSKRTHEEVEFYLPQLCQLSIAKQTRSSLHRFLLDRASNSMNFALQLSWFYQAILEDQHPKVSSLALQMTQETEMVVVNCKLFTPARFTTLDSGQDTELHISAQTVFDRRICVRLILENASQVDKYNTCTPLDMLEKPRLFEKIIHNTFTISCLPSKIKIPSPYARLGNPLDFQVHPSLDSNADIQVELRRLIMKQRRLNYFNTVNSFVKLCMEVSNLLTNEPKRDLRQPLLKQYIEALNEWMLVRRCIVASYEESFAYTGLSLPLKCLGGTAKFTIPFEFLRIVENETNIFFSRKRAPFVIYIEVGNLDEDAAQLSQQGELKASIASFDNLYVFDAIVDDLIERDILGISEVNAMQNPLECIRYAIGMLPQSSIDRMDSIPIASRALRTRNQSKTPKQEQTPKDDINLAEMTPLQVRRFIWPELLHEKKERIRKQSPYGKLQTWDLKAVIIKGGDDLRQENMVSQLLRLFVDIFENAQIPLWLRPMEILVTGSNSGIMEFLNDTASVDVLKRKFNVESVAKIFDALFADNIYEARKNFVESHAAYSVISYLLQVKDRHNGNILLDSMGHVIHIDYGFCLSNCPGNFNFETSPFKLTTEYLDMMGGEASDNFCYFRTLVIRGLLEARKYVDRIVLLVEMMTTANKMPCFVAGTTYTIEALRDRFMLHQSEQTCIDRINGMIDESVNNFRTIQYDKYQRLTNGIK